MWRFSMLTATATATANDNSGRQRRTTTTNDKRRTWLCTAQAWSLSPPCRFRLDVAEDYRKARSPRPGPLLRHCSRLRPQTRRHPRRFHRSAPDSTPPLATASGCRRIVVVVARPGGRRAPTRCRGKTPARGSAAASERGHSARACGTVHVDGPWCRRGRGCARRRVLVPARAGLCTSTGPGAGAGGGTSRWALVPARAGCASCMSFMTLQQVMNVVHECAPSGCTRARPRDGLRAGPSAGAGGVVHVDGSWCRRGRGSARRRGAASCMSFMTLQHVMNTVHEPAPSGSTRLGRGMGSERGHRPARAGLCTSTGPGAARGCIMHGVHDPPASHERRA